MTCFCDPGAWGGSQIRIEWQQSDGWVQVLCTHKSKRGKVAISWEKHRHPPSVNRFILLLLSSPPSPSPRFGGKMEKKKSLFFFVSFFLGWRDERRMEVSSPFRPAAGGRSQSRSKRARAVKRSGNFWQQETLDLPQKTPIVKKCDFVREVCKFSA